MPGYEPFHPAYEYLFNSYDDAVGEPHRGLLSRPTVEEVRRYRRHVDEVMTEALGKGILAALGSVVELGLHHDCPRCPIRRRQGRS